MPVLMAFGLAACAPTVEQGQSSSERLALVLSNADGDLDIYLVNLDDGQFRNITDNDVNDGQAVWSPDGSKIVYVQSGAGSNDLVLYDLATDSHRKITDHPGVEMTPHWSPDGESIVYATMRQEEGAGIWRQSIESGEARELFRSATEVVQPRWSPDGRQIAFLENTVERGSNILTVPADGGEARAVVDDPKAAKTQLRWSPDSNNILFVARREKIVGLYEKDLESGTDRPIHSTVFIESGGEYSSRDGHIAFMSARGNGARLQIFVDDGNDARRLTHTDLEESDLTWLPDESGFLFTRYVDGRFQAMWLDLDSMEEKLIAPSLGGVHYAPRAQP